MSVDGENETNLSSWTHCLVAIAGQNNGWGKKESWEDGNGGLQGQPFHQGHVGEMQEFVSDNLPFPQDLMGQVDLCFGIGLCFSQ